MVLLRVVSKDEKQIEQIAHMLLEKSLVIDVNMKRHLDRAELEEGVLRFVPVYLLTAKTKGLLFPTIDKLLNERFPDKLPEVYSLPIVHMDWAQSRHLSNEVLPA